MLLTGHDVDLFLSPERIKLLVHARKIFYQKAPDAAVGSWILSTKCRVLIDL